MLHHLELGVDTFGDITVDAVGRPHSPAQVIRDVVEEAVLADELGLEFIGLGEHHRVGVGGSPESVVRAARHGLPLVVAIIGGEPRRFAPLVDLYRRALEEFGRDQQPVAVHSPGYVAETDEQARDELWPHYAAMHARIGREWGWAPMTREQFDLTAGPDGALFVRSAETVAAKIVRVATQLGLARFDLKYSAGTLPHARLMRCIELYGGTVAPLVRERLGASA